MEQIARYAKYILHFLKLKTNRTYIDEGLESIVSVVCKISFDVLNIFTFCLQRLSSL